MANEADFAELRARVEGYRLPGGGFRVTPHERFLSHDAMGAPGIPDPVLHPVWILLGALRGMGLTIEDLVGVAEATPQDGVLFGSTELKQLSPLRAGVDYVVEGEIKELSRHHGKRAGTMDRLVFEMRIASQEGLCAVNEQTFLIMRRNEVEW